MKIVSAKAFLDNAWQDVTVNSLNELKELVGGTFMRSIKTMPDPQWAEIDVHNDRGYIVAFAIVDLT